MNERHTLFGVAVCIALIAGSAVPLRADQQEPAAKDGSPWAASDEIEVVKLNHARAGALVGAIRELNAPVRASTASGNTIILRGTKDAVTRVIQTIIEPSDQPEDVGGQAGKTAFIRLRHDPSPKVLGELLETITDDYGMARYAIDGPHRMLVVRAPESELTAIRKLVAALDEPRRPIIVRAFFLRASVNPHAEGATGNLPSELQPIAVALAEDGFSTPSLVAPVVIATQEDTRFEASSVLHEPTAHSGEHLEFNVKGSARVLPDDNMVQLRIALTMDGQYMDDQAKKQFSNFNSEATIVAKLDEYVVLAASPASTASGNAVAVVLCVSAE